MSVTETCLQYMLLVKFMCGIVPQKPDYQEIVIFKMLQKF